MKRFRVSGVLGSVVVLSLLLTVRGSEGTDAPKRNQAARSSAPLSGRATAGALEVLDNARHPIGLCPLKHTDVKATIGGFMARVSIVQEFENNSPEKIEAVYTFPPVSYTHLTLPTIYSV